MTLGSTQPITETSTRDISWGVKVAGVYGWESFYLHVLTALKSGSLSLLKLSGPLQGLLYLYFASWNKSRDVLAQPSYPLRICRATLTLLPGGFVTWWLMKQHSVTIVTLVVYKLLRIIFFRSCRTWYLLTINSTVKTINLYCLFHLLEKRRWRAFLEFCAVCLSVRNMRLLDNDTV